MANIYKNEKKDLTTATVTTLYTVDLFDGDPASANKFTLFNTTAIDANASTQLLTEPLIMMESEVLQVTAADANRLFATASILEINREDK